MSVELVPDGHGVPPVAELYAEGKAADAVLPEGAGDEGELLLRQKLDDVELRFLCLF